MSDSTSKPVNLLADRILKGEVTHIQDVFPGPTEDQVTAILEAFWGPEEMCQPVNFLHLFKVGFTITRLLDAGDGVNIIYLEGSKFSVLKIHEMLNDWNPSKGWSDSSPLRHLEGTQTAQFLNRCSRVNAQSILVEPIDD